MIQTKPGKGVCADAFLKNETLVVGDVHAYPGHIGELPSPLFPVSRVYMS